ncbi:MAG: hypothetical protein QNJ60_04595 [Xenococcaceae cyanobacterium MO_188.B19]|nr:hypothetical protein [Xenococcaceae cyanobacterium MO_188.B19]
MGDLSFNIIKDVNLNKVVNLNINKNVDVNVENKDLLATAEADAEAFGLNALAEVDAYTYVREEDGGVPPTSAEGTVDLLGNSLQLDFDDGSNTDGVYDNINIIFEGDGTAPPDVDDINGFGSLTSLTTPPEGTSPPITPDAPLPQTGVLEITDFNLERTEAPVFITPDGDLEAEYRLTQDWIVNFGERTLDLNGDGLTGSGDFILTVPEGTEFLAEYVGPGEIPPVTPPLGPIELEFEAFVNNNAAVITYNDPCIIDGSTDFQVTEFVFEAETLQNPAVGISDWATQFTVVGDCPGGSGGDGEAFAYAESTAAIDLDGIM